MVTEFIWHWVLSTQGLFDAGSIGHRVYLTLGPFNTVFIWRWVHWSQSFIDTRSFRHRVYLTLGFIWLWAQFDWGSSLILQCDCGSTQLGPIDSGFILSKSPVDSGWGAVVCCLMVVKAAVSLIASEKWYWLWRDTVCSFTLLPGGYFCGNEYPPHYCTAAELDIETSRLIKRVLYKVRRTGVPF